RRSACVARRRGLVRSSWWCLRSVWSVEEKGRGEPGHGSRKRRKALDGVPAPEGDPPTGVGAGLHAQPPVGAGGPEPLVERGEPGKRSGVHREGPPGSTTTRKAPDDRSLATAKACGASSMPNRWV